MGRIAEAFSCATQWQSRIDLSLNFQPPQNLGFGDRLRLTTTMMNASGAMIRLLRLEDTPLGRSASTTTPDARLLYVTGFDPNTRAYTYRVNQLFGEPLDYGTARRRFPPFQMQVGVEYKLGGPPTSPMARSLGLLPGSKEPALTEAQVRLKVGAMSRNPVAPILAMKDSLVLTRAQDDSLTAINARYQATADSLLEPLVSLVLSKGKKLNDADLNQRLAKIQPTITKMMLESRTAALGVLQAEQRAMLPASVTGGASGMPPGAPRPAGAAPPTAGGEIRVIRPESF